jgi:thiol-disulfide isomerase/thioredoxin
MRVLSAVVSAVCFLVLAGCGAEADSSAGDVPETSTPGTALEPQASASEPATGEPADTAPIEVADALRFTGTTVAGEPFDAASLAGRPAVLWFWAPWCHVCKGQTPNVSSLAEEYAGEVNVVGIAGLSDDTAGIADFAEDTSGITNLSDSEGEIWRRFGIVEQSVFTVIDRNGEIVSEGFLEDDELNDLVATLAG